MQKFALLVLFLVHLIIIFLLLGFLVLVAAGLCSTAGWQEVPASFNCPEIPARLETLDNRKQIWSLTQTYPSKDQFINWGTVLWAGETLPEQGSAEPMPQSCLSASTQPCTPLSHSGGSPPTAATDLSWLCAYEQSWKYHWKTLNAAKTLWLIRVTRLACEILVDICGPCYYFS